MSAINSLVVTGNLTRDAEVKYTSQGLCTVRFTLAQNRRKKQGESWVDYAEFYDAKFLGKQAEAVSKYLVKGKQIAVQGEIRQDRWEKDGVPQSKVYIGVQTLQLLGGSGTSTNSNAPKSSQSNTAQPSNPQTYESEEFEDDIPF